MYTSRNVDDERYKSKVTLYRHTYKGSFTFFGFYVSVQRVLFLLTPSPYQHTLKVLM